MHEFGTHQILTEIHEELCQYYRITRGSVEEIDQVCLDARVPIRIGHPQGEIGYCIDFIFSSLVVC